MQDSLGTALMLLIVVIVFGPSVLSLVAMRRQGKSWARIRIVAYSLTSLVYVVNSVLLFSSGNGAGGGTSAIIAWFAGKGALGAWHAWKHDDYRPAHLRDFATGPGLDRTVAGRPPGQ